MADILLTAQGVWEDFTATDVVEEIIEERVESNYVIKKSYLSGRNVSDGVVKIYAVSVYDEREKNLPALLVLQDFTKPISEGILIELAKKGYYVLAVDLKGKGEGYYTEYPESISYANYESVKNNLLEVKESVKETCWYEWGCVAKYALKYLKSQNFKKYAALGIRLGADVLWHLAGTEELDGVIFAFGTGWRTYKNKFKFAESTDITEFDETLYKYLAGVEAQAYVQYVKAPVLILTATNSRFYDFERSYDTFLRLDNAKTKVINCSVGAGEVLDYECFKDVELFLKKTLKEENVILPKELDFTAEVEQNNVKLEIMPDKEGLKKLEIYKAENVLNPALRAWVKIKELTEFEDTTFNVEITHKVNMMFFLIKGVYENGFTLSSGVVAKKIQPTLDAERVNILYSAIKNENKFFSYIDEKSGDFVNSNFIIRDIDGLVEEKGPMAIKGIYSETGIISFSINNEIAKFNEHAILMFDLYTKEDNEVEVELIVDALKPTKTSYYFRKAVPGSNIWRDFRVEGIKMKTAEGKTLQSFDNVNLIILRFKEKYIINNVMWI